MSAVLAIAAAAATVGVCCLAGLTYWIEQRRVRPIVICHEHRKRYAKISGPNNSYWAATVCLTNEGTASAFNVRFGIDMAGNHMFWRHGRDDEKPSRLNVLRPNERAPVGDGVREVYIDDRVLWAISQALGGEGDADEGRAYWAYYQGPAGDWWYTSNPANRTDDLVIQRVRSRRFGPISRGNRKLVESIERGRAIRTQAIRDVNAAADDERARREAAQRVLSHEELESDA